MLSNIHSKSHRGNAEIKILILSSNISSSTLQLFSNPNVNHESNEYKYSCINSGRMKKIKLIGIAFALMIWLLTESSAQITIGTTEVDTTTIVSGLDTPWEILWGSDDFIWITERYGRVSRLNPETGEISELVRIDEVHEQSESGLLGLVLHPEFPIQPFVFLVYNYLESSSIKERLVRYTYSNGELVSPLILLEGISGNGNHNGSRLVIDADHKLYMTTGDAGNTSTSQNLNSLNGKVLRLNLDGTVPDDNPFPGSYIWSWGHRNAQGLVISPSGTIYSSEHGPSSDDEVNIIEKGRNYGWPNVKGFCDQATENSFCADSNVFEPIAAWTPTLAVAGTDFYDHAEIPAWKNSLLVTSLKAARMVALKLSEDGTSVVQEEAFFQNWYGRLRDICVSTDGRVFLAVTNRDGRGSIQPGDDRIVQIAAKKSTGNNSLGTVRVPDLRVYPNPIEGDNFTLEYNTGTEVMLIIYDQLGREVFRKTLSPLHTQTSLPLQGPKGIYHIKIISPERAVSMNVMKL